MSVYRVDARLFCRERIPFVVIFGAPFALSRTFGIEIGQEGIEDTWKDTAQWVITLIASIIYYTLMESGERSATYGKQLMGIKVLNTKGERISRMTAFARWISHLASCITLGVGYLIQPFTPRKRTLHDLIAGTVVVESMEDRPYSKKVKDIAIGVVIVFILACAGNTLFLANSRSSNYMALETFVKQSQESEAEIDTALASVNKKLALEKNRALELEKSRLEKLLKLKQITEEFYSALDNDPEPTAKKVLSGKILKLKEAQLAVYLELKEIIKELEAETADEPI